MQPEFRISQLLPFTIPIAVLIGFIYHAPILTGVVTIAGLFGSGLLENYIKRDSAFSFELVKQLPANEGNDEYPKYYYLSIIYFILYLGILALGFYYAQYEQPTYIWIGYGLIVSFVAALNLNLCHEFMHSKKRPNKIISRIMASFCFWGTHEYEHLFFHHNENIICTEEDKSFSQLNQSVYSYILQSIIYNFKHAWKIQATINQRNGASTFNLFKNTLLQTLFLSILIGLSVWIFIGFYALLFFLVQGIFGIIWFLATSYNQHYGLLRRKKADNNYEAFTIMNIWSSDHYISGRIYFNLTHHAHHHVYQFCRYPDLKIIERAPLLPYGYLLSMFVCFMPAVWYKIMNKRVEQIFLMRDEYEKIG